MSAKKLTANCEDLSTERGFQFRFRCDVCGRGYVSHLQTYTARLVPDVPHTSGGLFGAIWGHAGESSQGSHHHAHDEAFAMAVAEARANFAHCTGCGKWVCTQRCWHTAAGFCKDCAHSRP